jgi:Tfp pilus assembly protein PilZ
MAMAANPSLWLQYPDRAALVQDFENNLKKGRAFVAGPSELAEREACQVVIEHPTSGEQLVLAAEAVWINPDPANPGTGVQFSAFDASRRDALAAFVAAAPETRDEASEQEPDAARESLPESLGDDELGPGSSGAHRNLYDRMRSLSTTDRTELARQGSLPERVALERCFGGAVWEALLQNPQLTAREVARFARSSSLPSTLVNLIVANRGWLADTGVQQALLANPRVSGAHLERVLRVLPQAELTRIATHTSYRLQVRSAAKRLIVR